MAHPNKPRLKDGNEREPPPGRKVQMNFRPPRSFVHLVADGESWQSLGSRYKVPPTKIIQDNFRTTVPEEINWYLNHYVDCDTPTPDRYNWRFSTSARRGTSPRAGIVYVVLNWPVIFPAVKKATQSVVDFWFRNTRMRGGRVVGRSLEVPRASLSSEWRDKQRFNLELEQAGAPTVLADAISDVVWAALEEFTRGVGEFQAMAFAEPVHQSVLIQDVLPWPLLASGSGATHTVKAPRLRALLNQKLEKEAAAASQAVGEYVEWFEQSFERFRFDTVVKQVQVQVLPSPDRRRPSLGIATGLPTMFLEPGTMPEFV